MMVDMRHDALGVSRLDRRKDRLVGTSDFVRIVVQPSDQSDHHAQFGGKIIEQAQQTLVGGNLADQAVKAVILLNLPHGVVAIGHLMKDHELSPQRIA